MVDLKTISEFERDCKCAKRMAYLAKKKCQLSIWYGKCELARIEGRSKRLKAYQARFL